MSRVIEVSVGESAAVLEMENSGALFAVEAPDPIFWSVAEVVVEGMEPGSIAPGGLRRYWFMNDDGAGGCPVVRVKLPGFVERRLPIVLGDVRMPSVVSLADHIDLVKASVKDLDGYDPAEVWVEALTESDGGFVSHSGRVLVGGSPLELGVRGFWGPKSLYETADSLRRMWGHDSGRPDMQFFVWRDARMVRFGGLALDVVDVECDLGGRMDVVLGDLPETRCWVDLGTIADLGEVELCIELRGDGTVWPLSEMVVGMSLQDGSFFIPSNPRGPVEIGRSWVRVCESGVYSGVVLREGAVMLVGSEGGAATGVVIDADAVELGVRSLLDEESD
jgi:hypothetical protein